MRIGTVASSNAFEPFGDDSVSPQPMIRASSPGAHSAVSSGRMSRVGAALTGSANVSTATSLLAAPPSPP